jgi:penicillin-binding protein 2
VSFHPNEVARRGRFATVALMVAFGILAARFFMVQVLQYSDFVLRSERNRLSQVPLPAPRGIIYDRNGRIIAENVPGYAVSILVPSEDSLRATLKRLGETINISRQEEERAVRRYRATRGRPTVIFADASFETVSKLEEHRARFPGLIVQSAPKRWYPDSSIVSAFIGYTGEISEPQLAEPRFAEYKAGDEIGKAGLESQYEPELRGREGSRFVEVDARGRVVRNAGVRAEQAPVAGPVLRTNIDMELQRFVAQIFGDSMQGAAVVMEPKTGAVLAIFSAPGFDPNQFTGGVSSTYYDQLNTDPRKPLYNKAIQGAYDPGSTWKLATAIVALENDLVELDETMSQPCVNGFTFGTRRWRCHKRDGIGHGHSTLREAIAQSCDVYFYQLGLKIGLSRLVAGGRKMLFADRTGIDLPFEQASVFPSVPVEAYYDKKYGARGWTAGAAAINMSIGQGENAQTVVNMARFYTALANNGEAARPTIVARDPERTRIFSLDSTKLAALNAAMADVVSSRGTAGSAAIQGVTFAGKTGTAQNAQDPTKDHAWFVGFAPAEAPRVVVSVMVEFGLHGYVAARLASKIAEAYLKMPVAVTNTEGD